MVAHAVAAAEKMSRPNVQRFEAAAASTTATYRDTLAALGPAYESGYFLYRFSDPAT